MFDTLEELQEKPITDISVLADFQCGVPEMDKFLKGDFQYSIDNHFCKAFALFNADNKIVGVYALNFDSLLLDSDDKDYLRCSLTDEEGNEMVTEEYSDTFYSKKHYPALEISYLAIHKDFQLKKLGSRIIEDIVDKAET